MDFSLTSLEISVDGSHVTLAGLQNSAEKEKKNVNSGILSVFSGKSY